MEKNTNVNTNTNTNHSSETSHDQRHRGRDRSPMETSQPLAQNNDNNPTRTVFFIERSSFDTPATFNTSRHTTAEAPLEIGGGSEGEQGRKRGRGDGGEQQVKAAKKKGELTEVPKGEPKCATCNKVFKSWKALFGHLRSHPERSYRGALPPPTAAELDIRRCQEQLASTLLTVAQEVEASRRGLDIDLNQPSSAADDGGGDLRFDLNADPPPESDGEE